MLNHSYLTLSTTLSTEITSNTIDTFLLRKIIIFKWTLQRAVLFHSLMQLMGGKQYMRWGGADVPSTFYVCQNVPDSDTNNSPGVTAYQVMGFGFGDDKIASYNCVPVKVYKEF
ncbi:unnamed protein product [Ambrosiozyma monospora]|uniref:Unnamed protein product n=1 Tax=Ambrosiozyma monospora TaxID=43982 RepID=A0ACB5SWQ0_AMBMO|nr:unnamed protein product [Ambrosiozyma monospora]